MSFSVILSVGLCVIFPVVARWAERRGYLPGWVSPIIACYLVGILVSNVRLWPVDSELLEQVAGVSMLFGLPLLLFSVRIGEAVRHAGSMLVGFALCCASGLVCTGLVGWAMVGRMPDAWKVAGMLTGLYTGGTPNVQSIGLALEAPADYLVLVQASDVLLGGAYLLGLITFLPGVYARIFPVIRPVGADAGAERVGIKEQFTRQPWLQFAAAIAVVVLTVGSTYVVLGNLDNLTVLLLMLTTLSILAAGTPVVRQLGDSYPLGEYFILVFSVALGLMADFRALATNGQELLWFSFLALCSTTLLHLLASRLFRLDRDTVILSSVAAFYGPVFVVQVAAALKNQRLMPAGVAVSLLGFGVGNYLGIGLAYLLRYLSQ